MLFRSIITIGASIFFKGLSRIIWGNQAISSIKPIINHDPIQFFSANIRPGNVWIYVVTLVTVIALTIFYKKSRIGRAMKATASDKNAAKLIGIPIQFMVLMSFVIAAFFGGLAGLSNSMEIMPVYDIGIMFGLKGFCAAILGGINKIPGAFVGGYY